MIHLNFQTDFKIVERMPDGTPLHSAPFRFTYYVKQKEFVASYDGAEFVNCSPREDGSLLVVFDHHGLGIGELRVKREYFLTDSDYADNICHLVSNEPMGITLDRGATVVADADSIVEAYYHTVGNGGGGTVVYASEVTVLPTGGITAGNVQGALVELHKKIDGIEGGGGFSGDYNDLKNKPTIPTKVSELKNDSGYISEVADGSITEEKLSYEVRSKLNSGGGGGGMSEIPDGGVTTSKIADGAVTDAKLSASLAATISKIDILYKVDVVLSGGGNKKKGTTASVTLSWTVKVNDSNVNPTSQTLNGEVLGNDVRSKTFTGVTENTTYTLDVDGVTKTATVAFFNPSYFGVVAPDYTVSSNVSGLTEQSNYGSRALTKTVTASGSMKVVYLYPSALGALTSIKDGNNLDVTGSFTKTEDITINGEKYIAYLLTQEANINGLTFKFA